MSTTTAIALLALGTIATPLATGDGWQVGQAEVHVLCPITVGGSFDATTTALTGTVVAAGPGSGSYSGEVSVDLGTLDSGIGLRNNHMRNKYLEVGKGEGFAAAVLSDIALGKTGEDNFQGKTGFTGMLLLHGTKKPVSGEADIRKGPSSVHVSASFPVKLSDYGIARPRYLGIGVRDQVTVKVTFVATATGAGA